MFALRHLFHISHTMWAFIIVVLWNEYLSMNLVIPDTLHWLWSACIPGSCKICPIWNNDIRFAPAHPWHWLQPAFVRVQWSAQSRQQPGQKTRYHMLTSSPGYIITSICPYTRTVYIKFDVLLLQLLLFSFKTITAIQECMIEIAKVLPS